MKNRKSGASEVTRLYKGIEHFERPEVVQPWIDDEFPGRGSLPEATRRDVLKLIGGAALLAGLGGCRFQAPRKIVPYVQQPEDAVAGSTRVFATSAVNAGFAVGLLATQADGRPIRLEPNPDLMPGLGARTQGELLNLYDPDRLKSVQYRGIPSSWKEATKSVMDVLSRTKTGAGVAILSESVCSPTLARLAASFLKKYPEAKWFQYEPVNRDNQRSGAVLAFGRDVVARYVPDQADVIVSIDCDLTAEGPGAEVYARGVANRRLPGAKPMSRIYALESQPTTLGLTADHRMRLKPSDAVGLVSALAAKLGVPGAAMASLPASIDQKKFEALAADLLAARGRSLIVAGDHLSGAVHAAVAALNSALGNVGTTILYADNPQPMAVSQMESLKGLATMLDQDQVSLLVTLGGNPVYTVPADIPFAALMGKADMKVHLSLHDDETCHAADWQLPMSHCLEAWGDGVTLFGDTVACQPLVEPLYDSKSAIELIDVLGGGSGDGLAAVKATHVGANWATFLSKGYQIGTPKAGPVVMPNVLASLPQVPTGGGLELLVLPDPYLYDGRNANNNWLQETPRPVTNLTWDNALLMSKATADKLGFKAPYEKNLMGVPYYGKADVASVTVGGRSLEVPVWVNLGQADDVLVLHMGYGRTRGGQFAAAKDEAVGGGFDANLLRTSANPVWSGDIQVAKTGKEYSLANTQHHNTIDYKVEDTGRDIYHDMTLASLMEGGHEEAGHGKEEDYNEFGKGHEISMYPGTDFADDAKHNYQWGMTIDLALCNGCNACVTACQVENNIPTVGKEQVQKGREMHWIRVDRYYRGSGSALDVNDPPIVVQPVTCMHCEQAPCEPVCPVAATTHSKEGLNQMVYNRCVGTRYCSNNCPYKVRRFNFFHFSQRADQIPVLKLVQNPDVTVRFRGVMEKCTYCVQRINHARITAKKEMREIMDGEVKTACQVACPTGAIVFGDIRKPGNEVAKRAADKRNFAMLEELNTRPRTTYLARVKNPNAEAEA